MPAVHRTSRLSDGCFCRICCDLVCSRLSAVISGPRLLGVGSVWLPHISRLFLSCIHFLPPKHLLDSLQLWFLLVSQPVFLCHHLSPRVITCLLVSQPVSMWCMSSPVSSCHNQPPRVTTCLLVSPPVSLCHYLSPYVTTCLPVSPPVSLCHHLSPCVTTCLPVSPPVSLCHHLSPCVTTLHDYHLVIAPICHECHCTTLLQVLIHYFATSAIALL